MQSSLRQVPNLISSFRILLIAPIVYGLLHQHQTLAMLLIIVAALSDGADGFLAKHFGWKTDLGAVLDPAADKLLVASVFVTLAFQGYAPIWLMGVAVGRDVILVLGAITYRYWLGPAQVRPSAVSKANTMCQIAFVLAVVARQTLHFPPAWLVTLLGASVFLTVVISGIDYVLTYGERAVGIVRTRRKALEAGPQGRA